MSEVAERKKFLDVKQFPLILRADWGLLHNHLALFETFLHDFYQGVEDTTGERVASLFEKNARLVATIEETLRVAPMPNERKNLTALFSERGQTLLQLAQLFEEVFAQYAHEEQQFLLTQRLRQFMAATETYDEPAHRVTVEAIQELVVLREQYIATLTYEASARQLPDLNSILSAFMTLAEDVRNSETYRRIAALSLAERRPIYVKLRRLVANDYAAAQIASVLEPAEPVRGLQPRPEIIVRLNEQRKRIDEYIEQLLNNLPTLTMQGRTEEVLDIHLRVAVLNEYLGAKVD